MALDGFVLGLPDTPSNVDEFGKDSAGGDDTVFPQARVVAISECASHAPVAADIADCWAGEQTLTYSLYEQLTANRLLTADRGFYSFDAWRQARPSGAELLWRISAGLRLDHLSDLFDGSWLALITEPRLRTSRKGEAARHRPRRKGPRPVRGDRGARGRLHRARPRRRGDPPAHHPPRPADVTAEQLACCYWERWEADTAIDQIKTHVRGPGKILRSRRTDLVYQEIWAYLLAHWALCNLMRRAATPGSTRTASSSSAPSASCAARSPTGLPSP